MTKRAASAEPKKAPNGTWGFVVDGGVDEDGNRQQVRRKGFKTKREAQEALDGVRGKARTASYVAPAKLSVKEYLMAWIAGLPATGLRASTVDGYRRNVLYVTSRLGGRRLDSLTPQDLNQLYAELLATGRRQKTGGLSARSVRYVHVVIHKALSDALDAGTLARNVAEKAKPPSAKSTRAPEMTWWSPSEDLPRQHGYRAARSSVPAGGHDRDAPGRGLRSPVVRHRPKRGQRECPSAAPRRSEPWGP